MQEPDHVFYGFYTVTLVTATVVCVLCVCVCVCVRARACVYRLMDIYDSKKTVDIYTSIKFSASTAEIMRQIIGLIVETNVLRAMQSTDDNRLGVFALFVNSKCALDRLLRQFYTYFSFFVFSCCFQ